MFSLVSLPLDIHKSSLCFLGDFTLTSYVTRVAIGSGLRLLRAQFRHKRLNLAVFQAHELLELLHFHLEDLCQHTTNQQAARATETDTYKSVTSRHDDRLLGLHSLFLLPGWSRAARRSCCHARESRTACRSKRPTRPHTPCCYCSWCGARRCTRENCGDSVLIQRLHHHYHHHRTRLQLRALSSATLARGSRRSCQRGQGFAQTTMVHLECQPLSYCRRRHQRWCYERCSSTARCCCRAAVSSLQTVVASPDSSRSTIRTKTTY